VVQGATLPNKTHSTVENGPCMDAEPSGVAHRLEQNCAIGARTLVLEKKRLRQGPFAVGRTRPGHRSSRTLEMLQTAALLGG